MSLGLPYLSPSLTARHSGHSGHSGECGLWGTLGTLGTLGTFGALRILRTLQTLGGTFTKTCNTKKISILGHGTEENWDTIKKQLYHKDARQLYRNCDTNLWAQNFK